MKKYRTTLRLFVVFLILGMVFTACGTGNRKSEADNEIQIVTSFYPLYVFTVNITKDVPRVKVVNMTEPQTGCLHDYQLVASDMKTLSKADIFVINGAGMESFLEEVTQQLPKLTIIEGSKGIPLLIDENGEENPHVWVGISGAIQEVKNIADGLMAADPANAERYRKNCEEYVARLEALKDKMHEALKDVKTRDIVTFHEAFPYFAQEFNLNIIAVIEREPGSEPTAGEMIETIEAINRTGAKVLFVEPQYSPKSAEAIAQQTGARIYTLDPVATGPKDASPDSYEKTMEKNLDVLLEALNGK